MENGSINITVNGRAETLASAVNVRDFLKSKKMNPDAVVVERNLEIIDRKAYDTTMLSQGDTIEILQFVGGG